MFNWLNFSIALVQISHYPTQRWSSSLTHLCHQVTNRFNTLWTSDAIWRRQHVVWKPYIFHYERIPSNVSKYHHLLESIAKIAHFYILTLPGGGGGSLWRKKIHFSKGCGEKMAITQLIIGLAPWNYFHSIENKIFVKIKPKRDTSLQKKSCFFLAPWSKFPPFFFFFFCLKGSTLTFDI